MQNTHDWTTDICAADNRVFVKGGLCLIKGMSTFLWLLTLEHCWSGKGHADVTSSSHHSVINRAPLHQVSAAEHRQWSAPPNPEKLCGKKGEFGYKYNTI